MSFSWLYTSSTPSADGAGKMFRSAVAVATFCLTLAKVGCCVPLVVDGGGDVPSLSPGGGEVNCYTPLRLDCGLVAVQFDQLGLDGCSLASEIASPLHSLALNVNLVCVGSCMLLLLVCLLLLRREPGVWL
jgi:hypothetical protein